MHLGQKAEWKARGAVKCRMTPRRLLITWRGGALGPEEMGGMNAELTILLPVRTLTLGVERVSDAALALALCPFGGVTSVAAAAATAGEAVVEPLGASSSVLVSPNERRHSNS